MNSAHRRDEFDAAFPALYRAAVSAAIRVLGDYHSAEDIAVEACYRAAVRWARVRDHAVPWTVRVAANLALDEVGRRRRLPRHEVPGTGPAAGDRSDLVDALRQLPKRQREVIVLRYVGDLSEEDTAAALGIAAGTVKAHAHRGLKALRTHLDDVPVPLEGPR